MLNKLTFLGITENDLLTICEYCSKVFYSSLLVELCENIEAVQPTALKIMLAKISANYNRVSLIFRGK